MNRRDAESRGHARKESVHEEPVVGGLYLDEAGEHPPDYGEPITYDERRWGGPHRDATRGGMPTISICRVAVLRLLAKGEGSAHDALQAIVHEFELGAAVVEQHTRSGENRLEVRVHWALATLRQMGFIEQSGSGSESAVTQHAPNASKRNESLESFMITTKGLAMLANDPVRIDENGTGSIRTKAHGGPAEAHA